jgi:hypothetical protein
MRIIVDAKPHVGARYSTADNKQFIITGLPNINNDQWVEYTEIKTKKDYHCRLEAFLARFNPILE